jgi:hypothetical protein
MKLLLILASDDTYDKVSLLLKSLSFELIRYRHVLKAMDNIDEVDPAGIIISANDFPRHWKTLVQFIRAERSKKECPVILLKGGQFPMEETDKAMHLEVNGIVRESLEETDADQMRNVLARCSVVKDKRKNLPSPAAPPATGTAHPAKKAKTGFLLAAAERRQTGGGKEAQSFGIARAGFGFMFSSPADNKIITGTVKTVSSTGLSFEPDHPALVKNLKPDTEIPGCSLRAGDAMLSPACALRRTGKTVSLEFLSFPGNERRSLEACLEDTSPEKLKA